jgi:hypothetical protein
MHSIFLAFITIARPIQALSNINLISPFIGSVDGGNVFAGPPLPYGMAKAVPGVSGEDTAG